MKVLLMALLVSLPGAAAEGATSPRDATPAQLKALAFKAAKKMRACALPKGGVFVAVVNKTEDYIDPVPLIGAVAEGVRRKLRETGFTVTLEISSAKSQSATRFESTYTVDVTYKPKDREPCAKSEWMKLEGKI